jgi:metal-dependent amidase/aminoacylase/carboxypeptidase family protein
MGLMSGLVRLFGRSAESGAGTAVYLATAGVMAGVTGRYFFHGKPARSKPVTYDPDVAARLWALSDRLTHPERQINQRPMEVRP